MNTALIYHPIYLKHDTGPHHPERASRLQAILRKLQKTGLIDRLKVIEPPKASIEDITLVHSRDYVLSIKDICKDNDHANLDSDTVISRDSFQAALFAAGAVIKGIDAVFNGEINNAFCMVRPPGHHARPSQAMGFCIFNNIAIGARYIQKKYDKNRILIIDWDVHHGNGTEEIFYQDPSVLYISVHQYPHYPGTGPKESIGEGKGRGFNLNIPMQAGSGDDEYINVFNEIIIPKISSFKPEFILISAGFDGHKDDPLSSLNLTEQGYFQMTKLIRDLAKLYCEDRVISVLEGGYNLFSLANSVNSHLEALI
ncbi:MAG: histone deacetylase [Candidatus Omnitrophica bacterium]|nr:histone deacetylase [Candidatus Omnitrophota bacterium]